MDRKSYKNRLKEEKEGVGVGEWEGREGINMNSLRPRREYIVAIQHCLLCSLKPLQWGLGAWRDIGKIIGAIHHNIKGLRQDFFFKFTKETPRDYPNSVRGGERGRAFSFQTLPLLNGIWILEKWRVKVFCSLMSSTLPPPFYYNSPTKFVKTLAWLIPFNEDTWLIHFRLKILDFLYIIQIPTPIFGLLFQ